MTGVVLIDDDQSMCEMLEAGLKRKGFEVFWRTSSREAEELLNNDNYDVVVTDLHMPGEDGLALCRRLANNRPDIPVIVITAFGSMETAVAAMRAGAYDFVSKPLDLDVLALQLERASKHRQLLTKVRRLSESITGPSEFDGLSGTSPAMQSVYDKMRRIGNLESSVIIMGESGTGKEVVARSLHRNSSRREAPFVAVNCSAISRDLLESELFGHVKGSFTGAHTDRKGLFVEADGGTLFLDEVADLPLSLQPKLLRVLEEQMVRPVGADKQTKINVRIISATNRDIETDITDGHFREDLYYRLNVIQIDLPPLRSRGNDILMLAERFLREFAAVTGKSVKGITVPAAKKLTSYNWPGNVRELRNCMEHAVAMTQFDKLVVDDLPSRVADFSDQHLVVMSENPEELVSLNELQERYINHVLKAVHGNKSAAAKILGLDRKTLYRKIGDSDNSPDQTD